MGRPARWSVRAPWALPRWRCDCGWDRVVVRWNRQVGRLRRQVVWLIHSRGSRHRRASLHRGTWRRRPDRYARGGRSCAVSHAVMVDGYRCAGFVDLRKSLRETFKEGGSPESSARELGEKSRGTFGADRRGQEERQTRWNRREEQRARGLGSGGEAPYEMRRKGDDGVAVALTGSERGKGKDEKAKSGRSGEREGRLAARKQMGRTSYPEEGGNGCWR